MGSRNRSFDARPGIRYRTQETQESVRSRAGDCRRTSAIPLSHQQKCALGGFLLGGGSDAGHSQPADVLERRAPHSAFESPGEPMTMTMTDVPSSLLAARLTVH